MRRFQFLTSRERVLWRGKPSLQRHFCKADAILIPMFLLLTLGYMAFLMAFFSVMDKSPETWFLMGFNLLLLCYALYGLVFRFVIKARKKKENRYYITNKRVIVIQGKCFYDFPVLKAAKIAQIAECNRKGIGTIHLSRRREFSDMMYDNTGMDFDRLYQWRVSPLLRPLLPPKPLAFFDVKDCKRVLKRLRRVRDLDQNYN